MNGVKTAFGRLFLWAGGDRLYRGWVNQRMGNPLRILCGHRVIDELAALSDDDRNDLRRGCLSLRSCGERMDYLKRRYRVFSLERALRNLRSRIRLPLNAVILTFDDGFADLYSALYPLMKARRLPFTVFLTSGFIGDAGRLTEEQIRRMAADREAEITWGAHGVSHKDLSIMSPGAAEKEILESKHAVERLVGRPTEYFCYPDGKCSGEIKQILKQCGFVAACATGRRLNSGMIDLLELQRIPFEEEPLWRFALRVAGRI